MRWIHIDQSGYLNRGKQTESEPSISSHRDERVVDYSYLVVGDASRVGTAPMTIVWYIPMRSIHIDQSGDDRMRGQHLISS
jgi:hypothetical protein